jgi:hypothetical protein
MSEMELVCVVDDRDLLAALQRLSDGLQQEALRMAALVGADLVASEANANAPGPYIVMTVLNESAERVDVGIGPDEEHWYYRFFETGAEAHEIAGNPLLAFIGSGGQDVVTGRSVHPGLPATAFLRNALDTRQDDAVRAVGEQLRKEILWLASGGGLS